MAFAEVGTQQSITQQDQKPAPDPNNPLNGVFGPLPVVAEAVTPGGEWVDTPTFGRVFIPPFEGDAAGARASVVAVPASPFKFLQTQPVISLSAVADSFQSEQPSALPFASASGSFRDRISFCQTVPGGCAPFSATIGRTTGSAFGDTLAILMRFTATVNGTSFGATSLPPFTGVTLGASYGGIAGFPTISNGAFTDMAGQTHLTGNFDTRCASDPSPCGSIAKGVLAIAINNVAPEELALDEFFSFGATITASPFSNGHEDVEFSDPISFEILDPDGNVIPGLSVVSAEGMSYSVVDGASPLGGTPEPANVPEPASGAIFLAGLASLGLIKSANTRRSS